MVGRFFVFSRRGEIAKFVSLQTNSNMRVVLDNVEPRYLSVLTELAEALRFTVSTTDNEARRAEIDRRIERIETGQSTLIRPDWQKISAETTDQP